jgi:hypothetical protein
MKNLFQKNIEEIQSQASLRWVGLALALTHILTFYFWWAFDFTNSTPICWSFFPSCKLLTPFFENYAWMYLVVYLSMAVFSAFFFLIRDLRGAYNTFLVASLLKFVFHLLDYRFMGNYHYMSHIVNFIFLFLLNKTDSIKIFIVLFYVSAGLLKFNTDWLTGSAMVRPPFITGKILELACAYAVFLELVWSWLLLSNKPILKWGALAQFILFHLFSWHIVGYYYPLTMFALLTAFVVGEKKFSFPKNRLTLAAIAFFTLAQIYPLILEKNSSLNGRARILSLNMLDAYSVCETRLFIKNKNKVIEYAKKFETVGVRIHCDPLLVVEAAQTTCADQKENSGFIDIDLDHQIRRVTDASNTEQFTFKNICSHPIKAGLLGGIYQSPEN